MEKKKRIFVVDDEANVAQAIKCILEPKGYADIIHSPEVNDALLKINENLPDIIFVDLKMPIMNGYEFIERLKGTKETKDIPVVLMSGFQLEVSKFSDQLEEKSIPVINKPFDSNQLLEIVENLLSSSSD